MHNQVEKITAAQPKSETLYKQACEHLVGGVNSPVRAFQAVGGTPRFIERAKGPYLYDVDGKEYIDFVGSWGALIMGHTPRPVVRAVKNALMKGTSFGAPTEAEVELAAMVKEAMPSVELLRFTNSGTEATMSALRLARAFTKRERIVKFEGGYHGHSDSLLVSAGSGATTFGVPSSAGVPEFLARNTWVLPYNDIPMLHNLFQKQGPNIAAVILEPVCGNSGVIEPAPKFLQAVRELTARHGGLLIFDEVMTGFRLGWGGAQGLYDIKPDLTCLGKIIGGGFPVGAFGGRRDIMNMVAPLGPVYQAGTLSGNPVAMAAGLATLTLLKSKPPYRALAKRTAELAKSVQEAAQDRKIPIRVNQAGSMFTVFFTDQTIDSHFTATQSDTGRYAAFFHALLDRGVYLPPSQFEAAFVSTAHTPEILEKAAKAFTAALDVVAITV